MSSESFESTAHIADGEVVRLHLTGTTTTGAELGQTLVKVQQPPTFKELNESTTAENVAVTGSLGLATALLIAISLSPLHRKSR